MKKLQIRVSSRITIGTFDLVCILLAMSILYLMYNPVARLLGMCSIASIIALCATQFLSLRSVIELSSTAKAFIILDSYLLIRIIFEMQVRALYTGIQAIMLLFFFIVITQMSTGQKSFERSVKLCNNLFYVILTIFLIAQMSIGMRGLGNYLSGTTMKICFVLFAFTLIKSGRFLLLRCLFFSVSNFILGERTAALVTPIVYVMLWYLRHTKLTRKKFYALFWLVTIPCVLFPYAYVQFSHADFRPALDALAMEYTGGRFFSGRNMLWELIFSGLSTNPLFGLGFGNTLFLDNDIARSTHNVYMFLLEVGGLMAVVLFLLCMFSVWKTYYSSIHLERTQIVAAYLLGLMLFMDFEMFLISNNFVLSLFWWLLLAIPFVTKDFQKVGVDAKQPSHSGKIAASRLMRNREGL